MRSIYAAVALGLGLSVFAPLPQTAPALAQAQAQPVEGEITRINKEGQKLSIRHGPLPHLDMPAMYMVYAVKDPALLDKVKVGSKITFVADKIDGTFTVLSIESVR
jgi:Cu(I)/Ag(I) efflux system periplasmic protein CusF